MTKTDAAFHTLRAAIEDGTYPPGEHLRLSRLTAELGMSLTPIREALRLLQAEGLVTHSDHRGTIVAEVSPEGAAEVFALRTALEPLGAELAAKRDDAAAIAAIRTAQDTLAAAAAAGRTTDAARLNADWHRTVYTAGGSTHLEQFVARLWQAVPVTALWLSRRTEQSIEQHEQVTVAIERRDPDAAREAMRRHIELGAAEILEHLEALEERRRATSAADDAR